MRSVSCLVAVCIVSCSVPVSPDALVSSLRFEPSAFDSFRTNTEIRYILARGSRVSLTITFSDSLGRQLLVRTIARDLSETKGSHGHTWLGDTESGYFAAAGTYVGVLEIDGYRYETSVRVFHF